MLPPPAFLTTEARLAPKGAAIDNAFHHTRCCCAFSSFQIFCVACTSWFSAALCSGNLNFVAAREPLHTKVAHLDGRINFCGAPPSSGLPPPIFPGPPHLTPFPSRAHALPTQPWIRPVMMEAGIGLGAGFVCHACLHITAHAMLPCFLIYSCSLSL